MFCFEVEDEDHFPLWSQESYGVEALIDAFENDEPRK